MIAVQFKTTTYLALNGRRYLTITSAANACAKARIEQKYPTERPEFDHGREVCPGWHYSETDWGKKLHKRLTRLYLRRYRWLLKTSQ